MLNNLSDREKKLVYLCALIIPLVGFYYAYNSYQEMLKTAVVKQKQQQQRLDDLINLEDAALDAKESFMVLKEFSLPTTVVQNNQTEMYVNWLKKLALDSGLEISSVKKGKAKLDPVDIPDTSKVGINKTIFHTLTYQIAVDGDLEKLKTFLYEFYDSGILHQISQLTIGHKKKSKAEDGELSANFVVTAFILPKADSKKDMNSYPKGRTNRDLDSYATITRRNLFGPANEAPEISGRRTHDLEPGDKLSANISAEDHPFQKVEMKLVKTDIKDAKLVVDEDDPFSAKIVAPKFMKEGRFFAEVEVKDNGFPALTSTRRVAITVKKPRQSKPIVKKKEPKILHAPETYISFINNDKHGIWWVNFDQRLKGEEVKVKFGDSLKLDDQNWKLVSVKPNEVILQVGAENRFYESGSSLGNPMKIVKLNSKAVGSGKTITAKNTKPKTEAPVAAGVSKVDNKNLAQ